MEVPQREWQSELVAELKQRGFSVGRSKSGNLLRVDGRSVAAPVESAIIERILTCTGLRELFLRRTVGINRLAEKIAKLEKLQLLDLEGSDFSEDSLDQIAHMPNLRLINIRAAPVSEEFVAQLRKKMIGCRIIGP